MSAFLVGKPHIDALVDVALFGPAGRCNRNWSAHTYRRVIADPTELGRILWLENLASVSARYPNDRSGARPGPVGLADDVLAAYEYRRPVRRLDTVQALKALRCYEYQSCEHDGWEQSEAYEVCQCLQASLIAALPGYDEAAWEVTA